MSQKISRIIPLGAISIAMFAIASNLIFAYTTDKAVYTPPNYLTYRPPAPGGSYSDAVFGTAIKRITDSMHMVRQDNGGTVTAITPEYSTMSPFNQNNTRLLLLHFSYFALYDGAGNYLQDLPLEINASSQPRWSRTDPVVLYYLRGNQLKSYNTGTKSTSVVHAFTEYSSINGAGESDICFDGNHFVLAGDTRNIFVYDISAGTKGQVLDTGGRGYDSLYITPNDNVTVTWNSAGSGRFQGIELFDKNMNFQRQLTRAGGHMDVTRDTNGDEVITWANAGDPAPVCQNGIVKVRLSDARQTCLISLDWSLATHTSATDNSGWVFVETYAPRDVVPPTGWTTYTDELLQVKLDGSEVRRLAHHRSRPLNSYTYMPKISVSRDGTKAVFGSNFGLQSQTGSPTEYSDVYMIDLSVSSPNTGGSSTGGSTSGGATPGGGTTTPGGGTTTPGGGTTTPGGGTTTPGGGTTTPGGGTTTPGGGTTTPGGGTTTPGGASTRVEQNGSGITYTGTWNNNSNSIHSGGSAVLAMDTGNRATFTFNGTGASWIAYLDEWAGIARVYVDGDVKATVDTYRSPQQAQSRQYTVSGLASGTHTLTIEVTGQRNAASGGQWVWVDAFEVISGGATPGGATPGGGTTTPGGGTTTPGGGTTTPGGGTTTPGGGTTTPGGGTTTPGGGTTTPGGGTTTPGGGTTTPGGGTTTPGGSTGGTTPPTSSTYRIEDRRGVVKYSGTWYVNTSTIHSGGSAKLAMATTAKVSLTFTGTSVTWFGYRDQWTGIARVTLDGVNKGDVDTYSASSQARASLYSASGLAWGTHTITIEPTSRRNTSSRGNWIWIDAFDYEGASSTGLSVPPSTSSNPVAIAGGASYIGSAQSLKIGYGMIDGSPNAPTGFALLGYRSNGVVSTEAAVPATELTKQGRIAAEVDGTLNTGIALANPNPSVAKVSFYFSDRAGNQTAAGVLTIPAMGQIAKLLDEAPFNAAEPTSGTLTFISDLPIAATALRCALNERGELLATVVPVIDMTTRLPASLFFPHFATGAGWSSVFTLINPGDETLTGNLEFFQQSGSANGPSPMALGIDGRVLQSVTYTIQPRGSIKFSTTDVDPDLRSGWVRVNPAEGNATPAGVELLTYTVNGVRITETTAPLRPQGTAFRMYAESNGPVQSGIAVVNLGEADETVTIDAVRFDGTSVGRGTVSVPAGSQRAFFLSDISTLATAMRSFKGVLRISTDDEADIAVLGIRARWNERNEFLVAATPSANETDAPKGTIVFPHVVVGDGYTTEFITFSGSATEATAGGIGIRAQDGSAISLAP